MKAIKYINHYACFSYDYDISEGNREEMAGLVCYMFKETFADRNFERQQLAEFVLSVLSCYRDNPYHNAQHAFTFTHTMFMILVNNTGYFEFAEVSVVLETVDMSFCLFTKV